MDKERIKEMICELIDKCDEKDIEFQQGPYLNKFEKGITFSLEGSFVTQKIES